MPRTVLVARGGASGPASGLGRAHHDLVKALESTAISGFEMGGVVEHELGGNPATRINRRWRSHPARVKSSLAMMDLLHITDQEQAHLVPEDCPIPVSVTVHDLFHLFPRSVEGVEVGEHSPGRIRKRDLEKLKDGLRRADLLICDSQATLMEVREYFPESNSICVPLGLELESRHPEKNPMNRPHWLDDEKRNLILLGSEEPRKRLDFAIRACKGLDVVVHKIGAESNSDAEKALKALAGVHRVDLRWQGRIPEEELVAVWQHADALLFPSIAEGFGYPPLEAMAGGTRVLVADVGSANEIPLMESLLPVDDVLAWTKAIKELPHGRCEKAMERAQRFSSQAFAEAMAMAWTSLFDE